MKSSNVVGLARLITETLIQYDLKAITFDSHVEKSTGELNEVNLEDSGLRDAVNIHGRAVPETVISKIQADSLCFWLTKFKGFLLPDLEEERSYSVWVVKKKKKLVIKARYMDSDVLENSLTIQFKYYNM
jgi:hypothetical protein